MLRIGLTGGIGAGKSTASAALADAGAMVLDADVMAREVVAAGTPGLAAVADAFGRSVLAADGSLDRPTLGRLVFEDTEKLAELNAIVHPLVAARRIELADAAPTDAIVVEDVPLLVEVGLVPTFALVVVVHAPAELRVRRLVEHRGMTAADAWSRVRAQIDDDTRLEHADVVLDNSGPPEAMAEQIAALWTERLVPFERNLRHGTPAPGPHSSVVAPDPRWPGQAARAMARIEHALGGRAERVDHIGPTAVPGAAAPDVLDIQVVLGTVEEAATAARQLSTAGLVPVAGPWWDEDAAGGRYEKLLARGADPARPVVCHLRPVDSPAWRAALVQRS